MLTVTLAYFFISKVIDAFMRGTTWFKLNYVEYVPPISFAIITEVKTGGWGGNAVGGGWTSPALRMVYLFSALLGSP